MARTVQLAGPLTLMAGLLAIAAWHAPQASASAMLGERLVCRVFPMDLKEQANGQSTGFDTADTTHPIGTWLQEMSDAGWTLASVQLAVGQKPTGFPTGFQQVCVHPR